VSALDHPDASWYRPTFQGAAGKIAGLAATARDQWMVVVNAGAIAPGHSAMRIASRPAGSSTVHYVNAIDPGTAGSWLLPDVTLDNVDPARLPV